jgi:transposase-like protein
MHQLLSDKNLAAYFRLGKLSSGIRPRRCARKGCDETHRFHRHGHYQRKSVYHADLGWLAPLQVQRFRCACCGKVFSLLIPFVYKWQRVDHALQQAVALGGGITTAVRALFSDRTLKRWKQKWQAWAREQQQAILQWLLTWHSKISPNVSREQARTPLGYLQALMDQTSPEMPGAVAITSLARFGGRSR